MYEQFLIHCFSDYWLQNDWMATNKKKKFSVALLHAFIYTIPFLLLTRSILALFVIFITHGIIDGTNIVNVLNQIKNWNFKECTIGCFKPMNSNTGVLIKSSTNFKDGYGADRPIFIRVWLLILQDNILHLIINYLSLRYL